MSHRYHNIRSLSGFLRAHYAGMRFRRKPQRVLPIAAPDTNLLELADHSQCVQMRPRLNAAAENRKNPCIRS